MHLPDPTELVRRGYDHLSHRYRGDHDTPAEYRPWLTRPRVDRNPEHWLGGTATMWWSHADAATYRDWITQAGLNIDSEQFVPEGSSGHQLFWARHPEAT